MNRWHCKVANNLDINRTRINHFNIEVINLLPFDDRSLLMKIHVSYTYTNYRSRLTKLTAQVPGTVADILREIDTVQDLGAYSFLGVT